MIGRKTSNACASATRRKELLTGVSETPSAAVSRSDSGKGRGAMNVSSEATHVSYARRPGLMYEAGVSQECDAQLGTFAYN